MPEKFKFLDSLQDFANTVVTFCESVAEQRDLDCISASTLAQFEEFYWELTSYELMCEGELFSNKILMSDILLVKYAFLRPANINTVKMRANDMRITISIKKDEDGSQKT